MSKKFCMIRSVAYSVLRPTTVPPSFNSSSYFHLAVRGLSTVQNKKTATPTPQASNDQAKRDKIDVTILKKLLGYLWPKDHEPNAFQIKSRIGGALLLLLGSKLINIQVPFIFKDIIDSCGAAEAVSSMDPSVAVPLSVVLGYGVARSTSSLMQER